MLLITPLTLKSTKGMLEMQRLAPEMRKLQQQYRDDRQKLNEEMMKLYQEHKVNPMASCLPLVAQMPVFIIMFRVLHGLTYKPVGPAQRWSPRRCSTPARRHPDRVGFLPRYISHDSELYQSLVRQDRMMSFGLDLAKSPGPGARSTSFATGLIYALLVVLLGVLYFVQQRMVAARAAVSPTMSPDQQKLMQYLPVVFAVFQVFFLPAWSSTTWPRRSCASASRPTSRGASTATTSRSAARPSGPATQAREIAKQDGGAGGGMLAKAEATGRGRKTKKTDGPGCTGRKQWTDKRRAAKPAG